MTGDIRSVRQVEWLSEFRVGLLYMTIVDASGTERVVCGAARHQPLAETLREGLA